MNNWIQIINFAIGVAGLVLSLMGLLMGAFTRLLETHIRRHINGMYFILSLYSIAIIISYYAEMEAKAGLMRWGIFLSSLFPSLMMLILTSLLLHFAGESRQKSRLFICVSILCLLFTATLISTFFSDEIYSISDEAVYTRGRIYPFLLFPLVLITLLDLHGLWLRRKKLSRTQLLAFKVYIIIPLISMLIQIFYYGVLATALWNCSDVYICAEGSGRQVY